MFGAFLGLHESRQDSNVLECQWLKGLVRGCMITLLVLGICFLDKVFDLNWLICVENSLDMMVCPMGSQWVSIEQFFVL